MESLSLRQARRLALARAGFLGRRWSGLPERAGKGERRARRAARAVIARFGYLQLDSVAVAGARSHVIVLLSRLEGFPADLGEELLRPGAQLFEYWGHEASWLPLDLYPAFAFRRAAYRVHPWWGDLIGGHPGLVREILHRVHHGGPLRAADLEGSHGGGWWAHKLSKKVAEALWSAGELAIRERRRFQRVYDLPERVHPEALLRRAVSTNEALRALLERALAGHGWATLGTLTATWRLRGLTTEVRHALAELEEAGVATRCALRLPGRRVVRGWVRVADLELAADLGRARPRRARGVLLSPFDPLLWDRGRVALLFGFEQRLEIFTPAHRRRWGYYCLPVLAGDALVARVDLKADRRAGRLRLAGLWYEGRPTAASKEAVRAALHRHAAAVGLAPPPSASIAEG